MSDLSIFNPRDPRFKEPYGAVPAGTRVTITLRPLRAAGFSRGVLTARLEGSGQTLTLSLPWRGLDGARERFSGVLELPGDYVGLVWYTLALEGIDGRQLELGTYQLTVYDSADQPADWFGQGMTYQIFPDRFCRTALPDPSGMVGGRWVHRSWEEEPEYRPDPNGEIRNRDFFGGSLEGVISKLDYLKDLGVETLYFCPIFEAAENHRYGTADYTRIDPMLGDNETFARLCREAHRRGMRVMLDGVFNHTGFVSRYFNGDGYYPEPGAYQSWDSPYRPWFNFSHWPDQYESWWGIYSLPAVNEHNPDYRRFIFEGEDSVVRRWLRAGADGWRLDVADELPDDFVHGVHQAARAEKGDAVIIGEVWEDGSTKVAYGVRRKHILGGHCDGLMNYPFRNAALSYLLGGDAEEFVERMETIRENYPPFAFYSAMNSLGTHDTVRILTLLGVGSECREQQRSWRSEFRLTGEQYRRGVERLKCAAALLFTFPGSPTVYYGDEAGMQGFEDPFNRRPYPWGREDRELLDWFTRLGALRRESQALRRGEIQYLPGSKGGVLAFKRTAAGETLLTVLNAADQPAFLPLCRRVEPVVLLGEAAPDPAGGRSGLILPPRSGSVARLYPRLLHRTDPE